MARPGQHGLEGFGSRSACLEGVAEDTALGTTPLSLASFGAGMLVVVTAGRGPAEGHRATDRPMYQLSLTTSTSIRDGRHQRGPGPTAGEEQQGRGGHDVPASAEEQKVRGETSGAPEARLSDGLDEALDL